MKEDDYNLSQVEREDAKTFVLLKLSHKATPNDIVARMKEDEEKQELIDFARQYAIERTGGPRRSLTRKPRRRIAQSFKRTFRKFPSLKRQG